MKFANELDLEAVPEWRAKYLNYKQAKKRLKPVASAIRDINRTPRTPSFRNVAYTPPSSVGTGLLGTSHQKALDQEHSSSDDIGGPDAPPSRVVSGLSKSHSSPLFVRKRGLKAPESEPLMVDEAYGDNREQTGKLMRYGSILASPPAKDSVPSQAAPGGPPSLKLPDPALATSAKKKTPKKVRMQERGRGDAGDSAYEAGKTHTPERVKHGTSSRPRAWSTWDRTSFRRFFSMRGHAQSPAQAYDYHLDAYSELDIAQKAFFMFLDAELDKIGTFYREKEDEATRRLAVLREQLHILRDRRLEDLVKARGASKRSKQTSSSAGRSESDDVAKKGTWITSIDRAWDVAINGRVGIKSKAMESQTTPEAFRPLDSRRDYVRRLHEIDVPYRTAKGKLKMALREYYRSLELLKSYALLNRTAFRKINKKFDKTVNSHPPGRYMSEKVNNAWFVKSDVIDGHINAVEDLYARYFEAGNHKVAANKLRKGTKHKDNFGGAMFRNGFTIALGLVFGIQGLVDAVELLFSKNLELSLQTSFLLQIYGGYFLMLVLMLLFCTVCRIWADSKVNYVFVFEFDTRDYLNWRQLYELPCLFLSLLGFFMWANFSRYGDDQMYIYFPVLLIFTTFVIIFLPLRVLHWRSRFWFLNSCWRLFWSGLYPVEFRDFFLGDMFCSLTYSMGNIEVFFCLYARSWENPPMCNSSHSRLLGFFAALPGIWRALQCIRRYWDTRNVFPHLVNCGKYTCTILYYVSLSLYRIERSNHLFAFFVFCGVVNGIYTTIWDLVMDWSLLNPYAKHRLLRDTLAIKQIWAYYVAMAIDPILRFNWVFYAIFANDLQHSAVLSFAMALSEAFRRGIWMIFRVENEHCTNVARFRAARDVPLPFTACDTSPAALEAGTATSSLLDQPGVLASSGNPQAPSSQAGVQPSPASAAMARIATGSSRSGHQASPSLRRRRPEPGPLVHGLSRMGSILHAAHAQDFERRRKDDGVDCDAYANESSDEDADDAAKALHDAAALTASDTEDEGALAAGILKVNGSEQGNGRMGDGGKKGDRNGKDRAPDE